MLSLFQALLLGLLQGVTEFLPVSSSAHLVLVPWLLGWDAPSVAFDTLLHLGTALAIIAVFWRDLIKLILAWVGTVIHRKITSSDGRLAWLIFVSAIPAAALGFLFSDLFEHLFGSPRIVAILLIVTALLLWVSEIKSKRERSLETMTWYEALVIGIAQGLAIAPGISRSGATLAAGLFLGFRRQEATRFAFLMAVPVILGAAGYKLLKTPFSGVQVSAVLVGMLAAAVAGYLVIRVFMNYVRSHSLRPFAIYCAVFGIVCFIVSLVRS
ncbi:MAG: undecaprenyl-diphosphatase UppP [Anaerolineae bacterium]